MLSIPPQTARAETFALLRLAGPLAVTQLAFMGMGVIDTVMAAPLGEAALAGLALGNTVYFFVGLFGMGVMMGLDALISQAWGAGDVSAGRRALVAALWWGLVLGLILGAALYVVPTALVALGYDPTLAALAGEFLGPLAPSVVPMLWFQAFRSALAATGHTRPAMIGGVLANLANIGLNLWFIDGGWGVPALGVQGIALSTALCRVLLLGVVVVGYVVLRPHGAPRSVLRRPDRASMVALARLGFPIGGTLAAEVGCFSMATFLMGEVGPLALAGHQIALNISSIAFMVPLALGSAAAVRTGQARGRGDAHATWLAARVALAAALAYSLLSAAALGFGGRIFVSWYGTTAEIATAATAFLHIAAWFQLGDVAQAVASGALRGLGDTKVPLRLTLVGYWLIAVPVGAWLCFRTPLSGTGLWVGLAVGVCLASLALGSRLLRLTALRPAP